MQAEMKQIRRRATYICYEYNSYRDMKKEQENELYKRLKMYDDAVLTLILNTLTPFGHNGQIGHSKNFIE